MTSIKKSLDWIKKVRESDSYKVEKAKNDFAVMLERLIESAGLKKSEFAQKIHVSAPYVSKMLRGDANLTIETMVKSASALDGDLHIHIAPQNHKVRWIEKAPAREKAATAPVTSIRVTEDGNLIAIREVWGKTCVNN